MLLLEVSCGVVSGVTGERSEFAAWCEKVITLNLERLNRGIASSEAVYSIFQFTVY